jgi:hypothetical protein
MQNERLMDFHLWMGDENKNKIKEKISALSTISEFEVEVEVLKIYIIYSSRSQSTTIQRNPNS